MANYKVKSAAGPWTAGQVITDADLAANPQYGGVKRLRDKLGAIEDTFEVPEGTAPDLGTLVEHAGDADSASRAPENTTGNTKKGATTAADADAGPNARGHRAGGKS
jgi:hypothetical protein